jgi:hypothetical protein
MSVRFIYLVLFISLLVVLKTVSAENRPSDGFVDPSSLQVISVSFAADSYSKANYDPFVKVRVYNDSQYEIVRAFIRFILKTDNGRQKVFSERFVKVVNGAMPAFSTQTWLFYPRTSSFWALHNIPPDAEIEAKVEKVFCAKKNSPWQYEHEFKYPARHDMFY